MCSLSILIILMALMSYQNHVKMRQVIALIIGILPVFGDAAFKGVTSCDIVLGAKRTADLSE